MCGGTRTAPSSAFLDLDLEPDELSNPSIGSVFLPLQRCGSKRRGPAPGESDRRDEKVARKDVGSSPLSENVDLISNMNVFKILSYNVWFREDLEVSRRMEALGNLIQQHSPDFICFQEVTPNIYGIFQNANWWKEYKCSMAQEAAAERPYFCLQMSRLPVKAFRCKPFTNSIMGRELCLVDIDAGKGTKLVIATSHLESPCPAPPRWDQMYSKERVAQAKESLNLLKDSPNVIFGGDMNWDDKLDGAFPLPDGWIDAWMELRPGESGWTYDTKANRMLSGNRKLQKRLDRFICSLQDFKLDSIQMVGMEAIPGLTYCKEKKVKKEFQKLELPVLPSDHYGLLLNISRS
ncbi:putative tyrosyl-DNA phosphodiesterase 2 [Cocos nucifera]|uniref:Putative tyrosyl-DNA phosphodiesterase 2 n=1 Tax=Cocos nucifera TaxID=13894 RepID=A0A8K0ICJ8_COCNU|nr:putative tyrosyl-DNA phosphodiesterase 2 [Cocos nucifera]